MEKSKPPVATDQIASMMQTAPMSDADREAIKKVDERIKTEKATAQGWTLEDARRLKEIEKELKNFPTSVIDKQGYPVRMMDLDMLGKRFEVGEVKGEEYESLKSLLEERGNLSQKWVTHNKGK